MPGQVIQGHAKWEDDCAKCHKRFDKTAQSRLCLDCHKVIRQDVERKERFHGRQMEQRECKDCHSEHKGRTEQIAWINESIFDHQQTDFTLRGAHADSRKAECKACHKPTLKYREAPSDCLSCHKKDDKHKDKFGEKCAECHTENNWKEIVFAHDRDTKYPLLGKHKMTKCERCHIGHLHKEHLKTDCFSCHKKDDYHKGVFGQICASCHTETDWKMPSFDHDKDTKYPLIGKHKTTKCESCHKTPVAQSKTPTVCYACHKEDDKHEGAFGQQCESCHAERDWKTSLFDHDQNTTYPLRGKHKTTKCDRCHKVPSTKEKTPTTCFACHKKDDAHEQGLGDQCERCHAEQSWRETQGRFDHAKTRFRLLGKHLDAGCKDCHADQRYIPTPIECNACHSKVDVHKGALGKQCESCHSETRWKAADRFDHDKTRFPIHGGHMIVRCKDCHADQRYRPTPSNCYACHKSDDKHHGRFSEKCELCHTDRLWDDITFKHNRHTKYPIRGLHEKVRCGDCHKGQLYKDKTPTACSACHRREDIHNGVFGEKCESCHSEKGWKLSTFDHDRDTKYVLFGRHMEVKCEECHTLPTAQGKTPTVCLACHRKDDPHKDQYGDKCESCHIAKSWKHSMFDHDRDTPYPLRDMHRSVRCQNCHKGRLYKDKTPTACQICHRKDDAHKGRFGVRCETCHKEMKWKPVLFDHDRLTRYPLRGRHVVTNCERCHTGHLYKDKLSTDCYSCHQKDDKHDGQEGRRCEACHTEERWREVVFDHETSAFPLRGAHEIAPCNKCHDKPTFKDTPSSCFSCHEKEDIHKRRLGTGCQACHNARNWKLWEFDHNTRTRFILDGAHEALDCYACHNKPAGKRITTSGACMACHRKEDRHEGGFGPQCDRCHITAAWKTVKPGSAIPRK